MSKKNKSGDPRKRSINQTNKYFSCWEYRENEIGDYKVILSLCKHKNLFRFPFEEYFGYRKKNGEFIFNDKSMSEKNCVSSMFGITRLNRIKKNIDYTGFCFLFGGQISGEISSNWTGEGNVKDWKGEEIIISPFFGMGNLREDLETFCVIRES